MKQWANFSTKLYESVHELTVFEKIWTIVPEFIAVVAALISADEDELIRQVIENDKRLAALRASALTS